MYNLIYNILYIKIKGPLKNEPFRHINKSHYQ